MKLISFDIGIKNMAYCIFSIEPIVPSSVSHHPFRLVDWNILNLIENDNTNPNVPCNCVSVKKQPKKRVLAIEATATSIANTCGKTSKYKKGDFFFCERHAKSQSQWELPTAKFSEKTIKKMKLATLSLFAVEELKMNHENLPKKKEDILTIVMEKVKSICLEPIIEVKQKKAGDTDLISIGKKIKSMLNHVLSSHTDITHVIMENQISPLANRMKTVQGMLAQYFIMVHDNVLIEFISSCNKLKMFTKPAVAGDVVVNNVTTTTTTFIQSQKYREHKKDGVFYCKQILEGNTWIEDKWGFHASKKKDDLADCFLQGVWYLQNKNWIRLQGNGTGLTENIQIVAASPPTE
jgi:hypothetical protein